MIQHICKLMKASWRLLVSVYKIFYCSNLQVKLCFTCGLGCETGQVHLWFGPEMRQVYLWLCQAPGTGARRQGFGWGSGQRWSPGTSARRDQRQSAQSVVWTLTGGNHGIYRELFTHRRVYRGLQGLLARHLISQLKQLNTQLKSAIILDARLKKDPLNVDMWSLKCGSCQ